MIRVGTYNVHGFVGRDGRRDVARVAEVIADLECQVVGMQEVDCRGAATTLAELEQETQLTALSGATIVGSDGDYGNALLTSGEVLEIIRHDISVPGREPRGAIEARLAIADGTELVVVVTHLGLWPSERRRQVGRLLDMCRRRRSEVPVVVAGDFNEWRPLAKPLRLLARELGRTRAVRTFPAWRPLLALDRIWTGSLRIEQGPRAVKSPLAKVASDHLPLIVDLATPS